MSHNHSFIDVISRDQRTAQRNASREGVTVRRDDEDDGGVRDALLESIRQQQREQYDVHASSISRSHHASPHTSSTSHSSSSSVLPNDAAAFAPSSRVRRSPVSNESGVSDILASLQQIRRSPSSVPSASGASLALGDREHRDETNDKKGDEENDVFVTDRHDIRLPVRVDSSSANDSRSPPSSLSHDAIQHTYSTLFNRSSSSSSPTPGGIRNEPRMRSQAVEMELEKMRRQLYELQQSHKEKEDIISKLVRSQEEDRQRRAEIRRVMKTDARTLINNVTRPSHTHAPVVKTEKVNEESSLPITRVPQSPSPLTFPSLSPSVSPSLIVGVPTRVSIKADKVKKDDDNQYEHKYDTQDDKKITRIGDLPDTADDDEIDCSDDEADIRRRDKRPDPTIKEKEPVDDNHLESYPEWALRRESLYPYHRYPHLYDKRHSLLTHLDRQNEWMRFGILTHFNVHLYGRVARRWFESYMQQLGDPLVGATVHRTRSVEKQTLEIPEMWYDPRDDYNDHPLDEEEQDLQDDSYTFEKLPSPIRNTPPAHERAERHHRALHQLVQTYVYHRKLKKAGHQPATPENKVITQDMRDEEHPCARCKVPVYSVLKHMCTSCEDIVRDERRAAIDAGYRPPLETDDQVRNRRNDVVTPIVAPVKTTDAQSIKKEKAFSLIIGTYSDPSASDNADTGDTTRVKKEPATLSYREQEDELTLLHHKVKETTRSNSNTQEDKEEENESPLGDILSVVFQPHQRKLQRRLRRTELGGFRERNAAVTTAVTTIGKFDGSVDAAPMYLLQLCSQVQQYGFIEREIVSIMQRTMIGNALMWLNSNIHEVFTLDYKPIQALLHRFRKQYIGPHITRDLRKQMSTTVLTNDSLTMKDLDTHYAAYQGLLMRLTMSDKHVDDEETRMEFFTSLPRSVRTYIGTAVDRCQTVHDVYVLAQKCVLLNASKAGVKQDGDLPRTIGMNALPALPTGNKPSSKYADKKKQKPVHTADKNKATAQCYHCGDRGHYTGECPYSKDAQTLKGQQVFAKYNRDHGWSFKYDQQWFIDKAREYAERTANNSNSNKKQNQQRRQKQHDKQKQDVTTVSDDDTVVIDEDDE
jgi:hypothetical protein